MKRLLTFISLLLSLNAFSQLHSVYPLPPGAYCQRNEPPYNDSVWYYPHYRENCTDWEPVKRTGYKPKIKAVDTLVIESFGILEFCSFHKGPQCLKFSPGVRHLVTTSMEVFFIFNCGHKVDFFRSIQGSSPANISFVSMCKVCQYHFSAYRSLIINPVDIPGKAYNLIKK